MASFHADVYFKVVIVCSGLFKTKVGLSYPMQIFSNRVV